MGRGFKTLTNHFIRFKWFLDWFREFYDIPLDPNKKEITEMEKTFKRREKEHDKFMQSMEDDKQAEFEKHAHEFY